MAQTVFELQLPTGSYNWSLTYSESWRVCLVFVPSIASSTVIGSRSIQRLRDSWITRSLLIRTICEPSSIRAFIVKGKPLELPLIVQFQNRWGTDSGVVSGETEATVFRAKGMAVATACGGLTESSEWSVSPSITLEAFRGM